MFTATRFAAGVAILSLAGSLALVAGPLGNDPAPGPAAPMEDIDPADFGGFSGTMSCRPGDRGTTTLTDWGSIVEGETYSRCAVEASDPRISGNNYSVHDYHKYAGMPRWGVRANSSVITNGDGSWVGEQGWGYQHPELGAMRYAEVYRGTGDYEGLTALMILTQDSWGLNMDVEGVIFPGDLPERPEPAIEEALAIQDALSAP